MVEVKFIPATISVDSEFFAQFRCNRRDLPPERVLFVVDPVPAWDRQGLIVPVKLNPASVRQSLEEIG